MRKHLERASVNVSSILAQKREHVNNLTRKIVGLVARRQQGMGMRRLEKTYLGDLSRRINSQKKRLFGGVEDAAEERIGEA